MSAGKLQTDIQDELIARCNAQAKAETEALKRCPGFATRESVRRQQGKTVKFKRYGFAAEVKK